MSRQRTTMQRTVTTSTVTYATFSLEDGQVVQSEPKTVELVGKVSDAKAQREVKKLETEQFIIISVDHKETLYTMEVSEFMKYATKEEKTNQEDNE